MHLQFSETASAFGYMMAIRDYLKRHGKPLAFDSQASRQKKLPGKKSQRSLNQSDMLEALKQLHTRSKDIF